MILFSVFFILSGSSKVSLFCLGSCSFALAFFPAFSLHSIRPTQRAHDHRAQHMLAKSDKWGMLPAVICAELTYTTVRYIFCVDTTAFSTSTGFLAILSIESKLCGIFTHSVELLRCAAIKSPVLLRIVQPSFRNFMMVRERRSVRRVRGISEFKGGNDDRRNSHLMEQWPTNKRFKIDKIKSFKALRLLPDWYDCTELYNFADDWRDKRFNYFHY